MFAINQIADPAGLSERPKLSTIASALDPNSELLETPSSSCLRPILLDVVMGSTASHSIATVVK